MPWTVIIAERANRDLRRLAARDREAVLRALERLAVSPGASNLKKLSGGRGEWRLRVGRWRAPTLPRPVPLQLRRIDLHSQAGAVRHQQAAVHVAQWLADHVVQIEVAGDARDRLLGRLVDRDRARN